MRLNMLGIGLRKNEPALKARLDGWVRDNLQNGSSTPSTKFHGVNLPPRCREPLSGERPWHASHPWISSWSTCCPGRAHRRGAELRAAETPIVRITDSDGAVGGLQPHHRHRRLGRGAPACWTSTWRRCRAARPAMWRVVARADVPGAHATGGRADLDRAGRHHTALWDLRARRAQPAVAPAGRRRQTASALPTEGRLAAPADRGAGRGAVQAGGALRSGDPMWPRTWRASPPCARPWATTGTSWWTPTRAFRCPRRSAARAFEPGHCLAGRADPRRRRARAPAAVDHGADRGGRVAVQPVGSGLSAERRLLGGAGGRGRIGGITPWLKVAHMAARPTTCRSARTS